MGNTIFFRVRYGTFGNCRQKRTKKGGSEENKVEKNKNRFLNLLEKIGYNENRSIRS